MYSHESGVSNLRDDLDKLGIHYHGDLIEAIVSYLDPDTKSTDDELVACSDKSELAEIKENFLKGKLGIEDEEAMDNALHQVCHHLGQSNSRKHRATFYYLLVGLFKKESLFISNFVTSG